MCSGTVCKLLLNGFPFVIVSCDRMRRSLLGRTPDTTQRHREERQDDHDDADYNVREGCLTCKMRAERHLNFAWGLSCRHPAQKAGVKGRHQPAAPCRFAAISNCGEIYCTDLGPVKVGDLKMEFESYLAAARVNEGKIPEDVEVRVGSRLKIWAAGTHTDLAYAYAHPNINGRPRYGAQHARVAPRRPLYNSLYRSGTVCSLTVFTVKINRSGTRDWNGFL